jgi:hypothetical protein
METQLVRLDAPYNIICGKKGWFALHIATLIVVKERQQGLPSNTAIGETLSVTSYPIVGGGFDLDGQTWMHTELKDCSLVCRQNEEVTLRTLKRVMQYCGKHEVPNYKEKIPPLFVSALRTFGGQLFLKLDKFKKPQIDYEVSLEFEESYGGKVCMVFSSNDSDFYFYDYFANTPELSSELPNNIESAKNLAKLRDTYLMALSYLGLRSITFTTKSKQYQSFVDVLNSTKD